MEYKEMKNKLFLLLLLSTTACRSELSLYKIKLQDGSIDCCREDCHRYCILHCARNGKITNATNFTVNTAEKCGTQTCYGSYPFTCEQIKEFK